MPPLNDCPPPAHFPTNLKPTPDFDSRTSNNFPLPSTSHFIFPPHPTSSTLDPDLPVSFDSCMPPPASTSDHPTLPGPISAPLSVSHPDLHPLTPSRPAAPTCPTNPTSTNQLADLPVSNLNVNYVNNQDSFIVTDPTNTLTEGEKHLF